MHVQFAELPVLDQDRAKAFYVDTFGCEVVSDVPMGPDKWRWVELRFPGAQTALHFVRRADDAQSTGPVLVFVTSDLGEFVDGLSKKGVTLIAGVAPAPYDPSKLTAEIYDSEGNKIVLST